MIYAQIKDGIVRNIILLNDAGLASHFAIGFDSCDRIDDIDPVPGIGYTVSGGVYTPPVPLGYTVDKVNYLGRITMETNEPTPVTLTLPVDLTSGETVRYTVGLNRMDLYLNGMRLLLNVDWEEIGEPGTLQSTVHILQDLIIGDVIQFQSK